MSKRVVKTATKRGELVLRLLRKEATAGQLAHGRNFRADAISMAEGFSERRDLQAWRSSRYGPGSSGIDFGAV